MKFKINELFFMVAFFLLQLNYVIASSTFYYLFESKEYVFQMLSYSSMTLLLITYLTSRITYKDLLKLIPIFIYYFYIRNGIIVILMMMILASKDLILKKILKYILYLNIFFVLIILCLYFLGVAPESLVDSFRMKNGIRIDRIHPGFRNPNSFAMILANIQVLYLCVYNKKNFKLKNIIILIISYFIYKMTGSRTMFLCNTTFIFLNILDVKDFIYKYIIAILLLLLPIISYVLPKVFVGTYIDKLSSGRLRNWNIHIEDTGVSLFGKGSLSIEGLQLDNSYLRIMLIFGLVNLCIFMYMYIRAYRRNLFNYQKIKNLNILIYFMIYGYFESILILPSINFSLLLLSRADEKDL